MNTSPTPVLVFVLGPTGSGKSSLAVAIARHFDGEIINCDSLQLYRGMDVGTAKTTPEERQNIPHYLLDVLEPDQVFSAGEFARQAKSALAYIQARGKLPIIAGGTGFYVRALTHGLFEGPARDEKLRSELNERETAKPGFLHRVLRRYDPASAARIHQNDVQKAVRAVEVCLRSRQAMSSQFGYSEVPLTGFEFVKFGLSPSRDLLYERINQRCEKMLHEGFVQEVRDLLAKGYGERTKALESIGYSQIVDYLNAKCTEAEALESTQMQTRRYAKRQLTWFRREADVHWLQGFGDEASIQQQAFEWINNHGQRPAFGTRPFESEHRP